MKQYEILLKMKSKRINNKIKYDKLELVYSSLKQMHEALPNKGNNSISFMKNCSKAHKDQIEEITSKLSKIEIFPKKLKNITKN